MWIMVAFRENNYDLMDKKVALRNDSQGYLVCMALVRFERTTTSSVKRALYPLSYSVMHRET